MDLNIVFEDDWLLIVNKPAGIATHPSVYTFQILYAMVLDFILILLV